MKILQRFIDEDDMDFDDAGGEAEGIEEAGESEGKTKSPLNKEI